jgi:hypothetical protein
VTASYPVHTQRPVEQAPTEVLHHRRLSICRFTWP